MIAPVTLATWIAFCSPSADPALATALVMAGSNGDPALITDAGGQLQNVAVLRKPGQQEFYVGLTQIPASQLRAAGIPPEAALNPCNNISLGWKLWSEAHTYAKTKEPTQWKSVSFAFSWYRDRQPALETPYSKKATNLAINHTPVAPAPAGSVLYNEIAAIWSIGQAQILRSELPGSQLHQSNSLAGWARTNLLR